MTPTRSRGWRRAALAYHLARLNRLLGRTDRAAELCNEAIALADFNKAHQLLARIRLPGPDYILLLARIHARLRPKTYVEIGVARGDTLRLACQGTLCIGIDPAPKLRLPPGPSEKLFAETSDDFFRHRDVVKELGGRRIQLAFIDGMHQFDVALRDFINVERHCEHGAVVLIHDCLPLDAATATRERNTAFWSGDVWKLILLLKKYRPDLRVHTVATPPTGLGVIANLDPSSRILVEKLDSIVSEYLALDFDTLADRKTELLGVCTNDWRVVRGLIDSARKA